MPPGDALLYRRHVQPAVRRFCREPRPFLRRFGIAGRFSRLQNHGIRVLWSPSRNLGFTLFPIRTDSVCSPKILEQLEFQHWRLFSFTLLEFINKDKRHIDLNEPIARASNSDHVRWVTKQMGPMKPAVFTSPNSELLILSFSNLE